jgi:ABC-type phosphate transport system ATPase subunit
MQQAARGLRSDTAFFYMGELIEFDATGKIFHQSRPKNKPKIM